MILSHLKGHGLPPCCVFVLLSQHVLCPAFQRFIAFIYNTWAGRPGGSGKCRPMANKRRRIQTLYWQMEGQLTPSSPHCMCDIVSFDDIDAWYIWRAKAGRYWRTQNSWAVVMAILMGGIYMAHALFFVPLHALCGAHRRWMALIHNTRMVIIMTDTHPTSFPVLLSVCSTAVKQNMKIT